MITKFIYELDAPPRAYVEFHDGINFVRFIHSTIRWKFDTKKEANDFVERVLAHTKFHLPDGGIILWRTKPEILEELSDFGKRKEWKVYFRFSTSPPLPESFWELYKTKEGVEAPRWKDYHESDKCEGT